MQFQVPQEDSQVQQGPPPQCPFCAIASGRLPSYKIYEDSETLAFLDINPIATGHALVIPKAHVENIFSADVALLQKLAMTLKYVAGRIRSVMGTDVTIVQNNGRAAGQVVPHIHWHLVPRHSGDNVVSLYTPAPRQMSRDEMDITASKLRFS